MSWGYRLRGKVERGIRVMQTPLSLGSYAFFRTMSYVCSWIGVRLVVFFSSDGRSVCLFFAGRASFFGLGLGVSFGFGVGFGFFWRLARFVGVEGAFLFSGVNLSRARIPLR